MENKEQLFETARNNFMDYVSRSKVELNNLAMQLLGDCHPDRFQNIRLKFFLQDKKPMVTFYAADKFHESGLSKKIRKTTLSFHEFMTCVHKVKRDLYEKNVVRL